MLRELLKLIIEGEINSHSEVARALGVDETVLDDMIAQLVSLGYLEDPAAKSGCGAGNACAGCSMAAGCHGGCFRGSKGKIWSVTDKGRKA